MPKITIKKDKCKGCLLCISFCPKGLIIVDNDLNRKGVRPAKFSRRANKIAVETSPPAIAGSRQGREEAGKDNSECLGCTMCAIICPDCCIEVFR